MGFREKNDNISKRLSMGLSLRVKIIVFFILSTVVAGIAYNATVHNRSNDKNIVEKVDNSKVENGDNMKSVIKGTNEENDKSEELRKIQEEKNRKLEDMYQTSYKMFGEKKYTDTIKLANKMIEEDPKFYKAYSIKGIALCYSSNFTEGMKNIDKSLELKSDFGYARFNKALAYELYGYYDDSLDWYDKALEVENYIWSYYGKASIYGRQGDIENAVKYLKIAINMSSDIKEIAREESDFNPVKSSKEFQLLLK